MAKTNELTAFDVAALLAEIRTSIAANRTAEIPLRNLRQKLALAIAESERVAMRGENKFHHYKFAKAADVYAEVRVPFGKYGIIVIPDEEAITDLDPRQTKSEGFMYCVRVRMKYTLMDSDSDETIVVHATGEGQDTGDKAIAKAKTFAYKYFLQQLLVLPTGDDPEDDAAGDEPTTPIDKSAGFCPSCGAVGKIIKDRFSSDGEGFVCWKRNGGCGARFSAEQLQAAREAKQPAGGDGSSPTLSEVFAGSKTAQPGSNAQPGASPKGKTITAEQVGVLEGLIRQSEDPNATAQALCERNGIAELSEMSQTQYEYVKGVLERKLARRSRAQSRHSQSDAPADGTDQGAGPDEQGADS